MPLKVYLIRQMVTALLLRVIALTGVWFSSQIELPREIIFLGKLQQVPALTAELFLGMLSVGECVQGYTTN